MVCVMNPSIYGMGVPIIAGDLLSHDTDVHCACIVWMTKKNRIKNLRDMLHWHCTVT